MIIEVEGYCDTYYRITVIVSCYGNSGKIVEDSATYVHLFNLITTAVAQNFYIQQITCLWFKLRSSQLLQQNVTTFW